MAGAAPAIFPGINNTASSNTGSSTPASLLTGGQAVLNGLPAALSGATKSSSSGSSSSGSGSGSGSGSSTTTGSSNSSSSSSDASADSYYNNIISSLQAELNTAQGEQPTLLNNIEQAANDEENQLNQQESSAESGYNTQSEENGQSRATNIDQINENSDNTYRGLMALLSGAGSGVSSAAQFGAPQAVAQNASSQRSGADTTYNENESSINSNEATTKQQYQDALADLTSQEDTQKGSALETLLNSEAGINQQIQTAQQDANLYAGENFSKAQQEAPVNNINSIESQLSSIFQQYATPTFTVSPVTATTTPLNTYSVDPTTVAAQSANPTTESAFLPYLSSINPDNQQQTSNILTGGTNPTPVAAS